MKKLLFGIAALLTTSLTLPAAVQAEQIHPQTFATTDITDIWFNALESGYGLQVNQTGNTVFVTIFIYGADGKPTWVTAQLTYIGSLTFTGTVFLTNGPYYGLPTFNPALVTIAPVGTMTFVLDTVNTAHIVFSINGVVVTKNIQRQPLGLENIGGAYTGTTNLTASACTSPSNNGAGTFGYVLGFTQVGSAITGSFQLAGSAIVCNLTGTISEAGRMQTIATSYACTSGEVGAFNFIEVTNRIGIVTGRISGQSSNIGCAYSGRFAVVNPLVP